MPSGVSLRCVSAGVTLDLPLWPDEIARTLGARQVQELERSGRRALGVPGGMSGDEFSLGFTVRDESGADVSVQPWVNDLEALALTKFPVQLVLGERVAGWFRLDPPTVTETRWTDAGRPCVVDVSVTLKQATSAEVRTGPAGRVSGKGRKMARNR